jgi:hypothetical protein
MADIKLKDLAAPKVAVTGLETTKATKDDLLEDSENFLIDISDESEQIYGGLRPVNRVYAC